MEFFLSVLGMVLFVEGFPYAAFPKKMKQWIRKMTEVSPAALRGFGLILMLTGLLFVYLAKGGDVQPW
ncbi:MAG: DUF2065 domain-containing protein [Desulfococcaceae bacterium]